MDDLYVWDETGRAYSCRLGRYKTRVEWLFIKRQLDKNRSAKKILDVGGGVVDLQGGLMIWDLM